MEHVLGNTPSATFHRWAKFLKRLCIAVAQKGNVHALSLLDLEVDVGPGEETCLTVPRAVGMQ